jgi:DNA-binding beta-propeller fold protein YncE
MASDFPHGIAVDGTGKVYVADSNNHRVVLETPLFGGGYNQSVLVTGLNIPFGIAVYGSGNLYVTDTGNNLLYKETPTGGTYVQEHHRLFWTELPICGGALRATDGPYGLLRDSGIAPS